MNSVYAPIDRDRKDYRVTLKVRNNNILKAAERKGITSAAELARSSGLGYSQVNDLINMKATPIDSEGQLKPWVEVLSIFLELPIDDMFSKEQMEGVLLNKCEIEVTHLQSRVSRILSDQPNPDLETLPSLEFDKVELSRAVESALSKMSPIEQSVISMRFGLRGEQEKIFKEVADILGISPARVQQIEAKTIRKLRLPSHHMGLLPHVVNNCQHSWRNDGPRHDPNPYLTCFHCGDIKNVT